MDDATARRLAALNRCFYSRHARAFVATRQSPWPGWRRLTAHLAAAAGETPLRVLDLGCGHGRFARYCAAVLPVPVAYVGVDASGAMLEFARANMAGLAHWELVRQDLGRHPASALPQGPFDAVVLLGVLHHLPGAERRHNLLQAAASRLAPTGVLAFTVWKFLSRPRFAARSIPWETFNLGLRRPLDPGRLEKGDVLLSFGHAPGAVRYCHEVGDDEVSQWLDELPPVVDDYLADGKGGELNRYLVLRANA